MSAYDPTAHGARCDKCFLKEHRTGGPVPPELKPGAKAIIVGEAPGKDEVLEGRPFVGASGQELTRALNAVGVSRSDVAFGNALSCQPPHNDLDALLHRWQRENKARAARSEEPLPHPASCCRPRLLAEILAVGKASGHTLPGGADIVATGKSGLLAVTGSAGSIMELRGGPVTGRFDEQGRFVADPAGPVRILPTLHPAFVMRARRWTRAFRADLSRAFRWFDGHLDWKDPRTILFPSLAQVEAWIDAHLGQPVAYDVETLVDDPLRARLLCVGLGTQEDALVVPWDSLEHEGNYWPEHERSRVAAALWRFFLDPRTTKIVWNGGYFDRMVIEHHFGATPAPILDGILVHRCVELELPHRLAYAGSIYTDVTAWKSANTATQARTDRELHEYNATDCCVTARVLPTLVKACELRQQTEQARFSHIVQSWCVGLHENGMYVDTPTRNAHDTRLKTEAAFRLGKIREVVTDPGFNPASAVQVRRLLFDRWGLPPVNWTKLGEPSTDDETLRTFRLDKTMPAQRASFFEELRRFRRATKLRGTYVAKLRPGSAGSRFERRAKSEPDDAHEENVDTSEAPGTEGVGGILWPDGRVRADWNAHGTKGWRLSSSAPNMQNVPRALRDLFVAAPGRLLVGADMDQLELRFAAALAGASRYLEVFAKKGDPHAVTAEMLWGEKFANAAKDDRKRMRDFAKRFCYACTVKGTLIAVPDARGAVPIEQVRAGDLVWCWDGTKYAPTRVRETRCHGLRDCVRVSFSWMDVRGTTRSGAVVFTPDHLFLLRDGSYRPAGALQAGDALMPFNRWRVGTYRVLDPFNDGSRIGEHRVVAGLLPGDPRVVHHRNGNPRDNAPENLAVLASHGAHSREHWREDGPRKRALLAAVNARLWSPERRDTTNAHLSEGRRTSAKWHAASVENVRRMREGLARARAQGRGRRGLGASKLDAFRDRVGVLRDAEVAALAGCTPENVACYRHRRGIPAPPGQRRNHVVTAIEPAGTHEVWDLEVEHEAHNFALAAGIFVHNCLYRATPETVHDVIVSVENEKGDLVYADMTMTETALLHKRWLAASPEFEAWWEKDADEWRWQGFLADPVLGLRCDFLDGEDLNALANFKCQCAGSAVVHLGTKEFLEKVPFRYAGPSTGLVNQCHDSLTVEVPVGDAPRVAGILRECLTRRVPGLDVPFTASAKIGLRWNET